jgi:hypothetical protein
MAGYEVVLGPAAKRAVLSFPLRRPWPAAVTPVRLGLRVGPRGRGGAWTHGRPVSHRMERIRWAITRAPRNDAAR